MRRKIDSEKDDTTPITKSSSGTGIIGRSVVVRNGTPNPAGVWDDIMGICPEVEHIFRPRSWFAS